MRVTVIGAGAGGAAAAVELTQRGHQVMLWGRSARTVEPFQQAGGIEYEGVLGEGLAEPALITTDIRGLISLVRH
ncbi:MAG: 2-dehydropantoate 2-reductase N-terminal domain-containing protein [Betaproteobacteria bacterium]